ncbi:MAG: hypothetical protein ACREDR_42705, partial [Blastocatellia bacterium]
AAALGPASKPQACQNCPPSQILASVWATERGEVWYGLSSKQPGVYRDGSLRLVSPDRRALSPELRIPEEFGMLQAIDSSGSLYFLHHDTENGLQLIQAKLKQ